MSFYNLKKQINNAVELREKGNLNKSRLIFEFIIKDINKFLLKDSSKELKYIYATVMGEYVIQYRLEAEDLYRKALRLGEELLEYDKMNNIKNPLSIRAVSNILLSLGQYERAGEYLELLLPLYKGSLAQIGDTKAHISYCYFRNGRLDEAQRLINNAIRDIKKDMAKKQYVPTWLSHAFLVKSLILNSQGQIKEAIKYAKNSLEVAEKGKVKARVKQSKEIIEYLNKKMNSVA